MACERWKRGTRVGIIIYSSYKFGSQEIIKEIHEARNTV